MAVYTDDALALQGGNWRITGVSLRSPAARDRLTAQNGLYSVLERSENQQSLRVIGCLRDVLVAPENPAEVLRRLTAPETRIVSMTITEKGYLHDPASGALMCEHPDILHDLGDPEHPKTMHGYVVESLARRRQNGKRPFVLLSCDNLPTNGDSLKRVILEYAKLRDRELASWIDSEVIFPNSMVDRIVPPTTPEDIDTVSQLLGCRDEAPVVCEPFSQWVIEEKSQWIRPAWEKCGVKFVPDVVPFEEMKLRLLNGSHSAMAYLGYLAGFEYIHQVVTDQNFDAFIQAMMTEEIIPTLRMPPGTDLLEYGNSLIQRFRNPTLHHSTWQIAMDGSLKLPQRLLDPIRDRIAARAPYPRLALAVAGWLRYITGVDEKGHPIDVSDPIAEKLASLARQHTDDIAQYVKAVLQLQEIFGRDLSHNYSFRQNIIDSLKNLYAKGAKVTVSTFARTNP
jgi:fructuronate reductase